MVKKLQIEIHAYMRVKSVTVRLIDGWLRKKKRYERKIRNDTKLVVQEIMGTL